MGAEAVGTWISIGIEKGAAFHRLLISNGYAATPDIHARHGRVKELKIVVDSGPTIITTLDDKMGMQTIELGPVGQVSSLRLEVLSYYPGTSARNICLDYLKPDFEAVGP